MTEPAPPYSKKNLWYEAYVGFRPYKPSFLPENYPNLAGKAAIVTGSNTGVGFQVVKLLYEKNCDVIAVVRTDSKGKDAREKILKDVSGSTGSITVVGGCDFLDLATVKPASEGIKSALGNKPLNIIIHNAGLMSPVSTGTSKQGYEAMFSVNVLGPQLLQHFIDPLFLKKDDTLKRIVWVSSFAHYLGFDQYGINWENPTFEGVAISERPNSMTLYGQSKAANIFQAKAWATRHEAVVADIGCVSVSCYPGNLNTDLQRDWNWIGRKIVSYFLFDSIYGAYTELYAALSPVLTTKDHGAYVVPFGEVHDPRADVKVGLTNGSDLKLWDWNENKISDFF